VTEAIEPAPNLNFDRATTRAVLTLNPEVVRIHEISANLLADEVARINGRLKAEELETVRSIERQRPDERGIPTSREDGNGFDWRRHPDGTRERHVAELARVRAEVASASQARDADLKEFRSWIVAKIRFIDEVESHVPSWAAPYLKVGNLRWIPLAMPE
jgi:hypothetical protein